MRIITVVLIMAVTFVFSGCAMSREARIQQIQSRHPQWDQRTVEQVADGRVKVGMTEEMVVAILGEPWQVAREDRGRVWIYMAQETSTWGVLRPVPAFFVYFQDGRVAETKGDQRRVVTPLR
jgi:outer membrane protein assembly factor BamE (lipoprotein component of BamABCDE complex)